MPTSSLHWEEILALLDWKRRIFDVYSEARTLSAPEWAWGRWRDVRDELFGTHPQSPLPPEARASFSGLDYFAYDAQLRVLADVVPVASERVEIGASSGGAIVFERFGEARFELAGEPHVLDLFWLPAYGGGLFLPFADALAGSETYPAGRYLLDTVKGADLGSLGGRLVLDFNFSYNPSCSYDSRWVCPLAPARNRLPIPIRAGEKRPRDSSSTYA